MLTSRTGSAACRDGQVHNPAGRSDSAPLASARDAAICALYREGATLTSIGALFGLSYEGVRKVAAKAGLSKGNAGLAARGPAKPPLSRGEAACRRTYGCSVHELAEATAKERGAFLQQRKNVRRYGDGWQLSLSEWRALWRASGKWSRRGRGPGKYGMTRIDLKGPVELGNVQIVTNREAVRRARLRSSNRAAIDVVEKRVELAFGASKLVDQRLARGREAGPIDVAST